MLYREIMACLFSHPHKTQIHSVCWKGRISRQLVAKVLRFDFEQDMKIQVLDMTPCLCANGLGAYTTTQTDGRTERKTLQVFMTFAVITALKYNKHPSLDSAGAFSTYTVSIRGTFVMRVTFHSNLSLKPYHFTQYTTQWQDCEKRTVILCEKMPPLLWNEVRELQVQVVQICGVKENGQWRWLQIKERHLRWLQIKVTQSVTLVTN